MLGSYLQTITNRVRRSPFTKTGGYAQSTGKTGRAKVGETRNEAMFNVGEIPNFASAAGFPESNSANTLNLAAAVSHEMRTPLHVAHNYLNLLKQGKVGAVSSEQAECLENISVSLSQMKNLLEDILCLGQMQNGQFQLHLEEIELKQLVATTVEQLRVIASAAAISLETLNLSGDPYLVEVAPSRLQQCLYNLLTNAIKFSPVGSRVTVSLDEQVAHYCITVADEGLGISKETLNQIFQPYFQVRKNNPAFKNGYGLGLSITQQLVEQHGGRLLVESTLGVGSRFTIVLPRFAGGAGGNLAS
jgi:signal transduction histidine kinase